MVSIRRYLDNHLDGNAIRQAVGLLIEKLGQYAVVQDPGECTEFRREIEGIGEALTPDLPPENVLTLAGSAGQALEAYNRRVTGRIGKQSSEFQAIVKMLRNSLATIAGENAESIQSLARIGEELERGTAFKDLQSLKLHLHTCLSGLREQIEREKAASKSTIEKLQIVIEDLRETAGASLQPKSVSIAVPRGRQECIAAMNEAVSKGTRHFALVMVVNRVQPINARFGRDAGDWMLARFKDHVETHFLASDQVFRWTGPAMVAVLERAKALDEVRSLVRRILDKPFDETYEIDGRSILIPISAAWSIFMLTAEPCAAERQIDAFIASRYSRDFA
jgi:GGDEF domain-containing protein